MPADAASSGRQSGCFLRLTCSQSIRESVDDVKVYACCSPIVLGILVIFLFLRNISATIIPSLALPLSVIGTFRGDVPVRV